MIFILFIILFIFIIKFTFFDRSEPFVPSENINIKENIVNSEDDKFDDIDDSVFSEVKELQKSVESLEEQIKNTEYRCNSENVEYKCNKSIDKKFLFGCQNMKPFSTEGCNLNKAFNDPSEYYKKLNPVHGLMDKFNNYVGYNMPEYSNVAKIGEIGKIPLDINKVIPVQRNFVFKNSAAMEFI
jgi:hypothetical protein